MMHSKGIEVLGAPMGPMALLGDVVGRWRLMLWLLIATWTLVTASKLSGGRAYETSAALVAVSSPRSGSAASSGVTAAAMLLGGGSVTPGLPTSPVFIAALAGMRSVLDSVGHAPAGHDSRTIVERLLDKPLSQIREYEIAPALREYTSVSVDRTTGIITVSAHHGDSVVSRAITTALIRQIQNSYRSAMQAQAAEQRRGQDRRVEGAASQLRMAEEEFVAFRRRNRVVDASSITFVEQQHLQRNVELARSVYEQVMSDREAAIARELEDVSAVAVVDQIPSYSTPLPRHLGLTLVASTIIVTALSAVLIMLTLVFRNRIDARDPSALYLVENCRKLPLIGRIIHLRWRTDAVDTLTVRDS